MSPRGVLSASSFPGYLVTFDYPAKRITITLDIPKPLPEINADPHRLQQVFWNLLSNAVKFTEPGGTVSVSVAADDDIVFASDHDGKWERALAKLGINLPMLSSEAGHT